MMNDFAIPSQPILLATDGLKDADAAVRITARLSESTQRPVTVVAVLDPRLATARYGSFLKASLPPMWTTTDPALVRKALTRLAGD